MRIAATYNQGDIFPHFGKTEEIKVFTVENGTVLSAEVMPTNASGHNAMASLLSALSVDVVLCGGIGEHAQDALTQAGIEVISGVAGDADAAVSAYLKGELVSAGVNCDHHHGEEEESSCGCGGGCGGSSGGCGGCGGGCGGCGPRFTMEGPNVGKVCRVHYRGTLNDGTQFDASYDRGEPLEFLCGAGQMIRGFDAAVAVMEVGQTVSIHLTPEEAYGPQDPNAILTVDIAMMPGAEDVQVGQQVYLYDPMGRAVPVKVTAKDETSVTFDANHELAGQELNFDIELISAE